MLRTVKSAERTIALFELFSFRQRPMTVGRIATELGIPQASASMLLTNLTNLGYISYDRVERTYTPTIRVALLGSWIARQFDEAGALTVRLTQLQDRVDETVFIGVQNGPFGQYVLALPRANRRSMRAISGQMKLLTMSATGRVLLSLKSDAEVLRWVHRCNAEAQCAEQRVAPSAFLQIIHEVQSCGFAETRGDVNPSFGALAVSVIAPGDLLPMAVGVGVPITRLDEKREAIVAELRAFKQAFE